MTLPTSVGFNMAPPGGNYTNMTTIPGIVDASPSDQNVWYANGGYGPSNNSVWMGISLTPGTNSSLVTNYISVLALNGNNNANTNWAITNLSLVVGPPPPATPLQIRFYKPVSQPATNVFILPSAKTDPPNPNFWWSNANATNNWTNWMATSGHMTVTLADIGVSGTNAQGESYYTIYATNMNNASWWVSYGGGHIAASGTTIVSSQGPNPNDPQTSAWAYHEFNAFEVTVDGGAEDVGDITFINTFGIPIEMRVFTNVTSDSTQYYQIGGYTNSANTAALVSNLVGTFSNSLWYNPAGTKAAVVLGPNANAGPGILLPYAPPGGYTATTPVAWPLFTNYFAAVAANTSRTNVIGDMISLSDNGGGNGAWDFYYSFGLSITNAPLTNSLVLTGSLTVTNISSTGSNVGKSQTFNNLVLTLAGDSGGPTDNWASYTVYTAPTPSGLTYRANPASAPWNDTLTVISTNATNTWVPSSAQGQPVLSLSNTGTDTWAAVYSFVGLMAGDPTNSTGAAMAPTNVVYLYQSSLGNKVIGRIMGDLAAGFALGFINSDVTNNAYTNSLGVAQMYGDSPSGAWWGGNQYSNAKTNALAFQQVQPSNPYYSTYGATIYEYTRLAYVHPIYDRMQVLGGGAQSAGTPQLQLQPSVATTGNPPILLAEFRFQEGILSYSQPSVPVNPYPPLPPPVPVYSSPTGVPVGNYVENQSPVNLTLQATTGTMTTNGVGSVWSVTGLPPGVTGANTNAGTAVQYLTTNPASAGSGAYGGDGGRYYALTMVMSNSQGLVGTNISNPVNTNSAVIKIFSNDDPATYTPTVWATPAALPALTTTQGAASGPTGYWLGGVNLATNGDGVASVTVSAPSGFVVSTNTNSGWANTLTVTASGTAYSGSAGQVIGNVPIYVQLASNAPAGSLVGNITNVSTTLSATGGAVNTSTVSVTGLVFSGGGGGGGGGGGNASGFATWGGGVLPVVGTAAYSNALLQYAFGGNASYSASAAQTNFGTASLSNVSGIDYLVLREIIRTNDANLTVWSEHTTNLTNTSWTSNSIQPAASADQTQATPGVNQVQEFRTPQGSDQRKFLRLKATYQNP
jgi:hypothetical protein